MHKPIAQLVNGKCQGMCGKVISAATAGSVQVNTGTASGVGTVSSTGRASRFTNSTLNREDKSCALMHAGPLGPRSCCRPV